MLQVREHIPHRLGLRFLATMIPSGSSQLASVALELKNQFSFAALHWIADCRRRCRRRGGIIRGLLERHEPPCGPCERGALIRMLLYTFCDVDAVLAFVLLRHEGCKPSVSPETKVIFAACCLGYCAVWLLGRLVAHRLTAHDASSYEAVGRCSHVGLSCGRALPRSVFQIDSSPFRFACVIRVRRS